MIQRNNYTHTWQLSISMQDLLEFMALRGVEVPEGINVSDLTVTSTPANPANLRKPIIILKGRTESESKKHLTSLVPIIDEEV